MSRLRTLWKWLAATVAVLLVLLAVAIGALRIWLEHSPELAPRLVARVAELTTLEFAFARLDARLGRHGPELVFRNARVTVPGQRDALVTATAGRVGFDWWRFLRTGRLASGRVVLEGARVFVYLTPDGVELRGQGAFGETPDNARLALDELPLGLVRIENATVTVQDLRTASRPWRIDQVDLDLERDTRALIVGGSVRLPDRLGARLTVEARLDGDLAQRATLDWRAEVKLRRAEVGGWTALVPHWPWLPAGGRGDLDIAAHGRGAELGAATARVDLVHVLLAGEPGRPPPQLAALAGTFTLTHTGSRWIGSGREVVVDPGHDAWRRGEFDGELDWRDGRLEAAALRSPAIRLDALAALVPLMPAGTPREAFAALAPRGALTVVDLALKRGAQPTEWHVDGGLRFTGLGFGAWQSVPGIAGIDGDVAAREHTGRLHVHSSGFTLDLQRFLRTPVGASAASATLDWWWQPDGWRFAVDDLRAVTADGRGGGRARLWLPASGESPRLVLDLKVEEADARAAPRYLPGRTLPPAAMHWLDAAFLAGRVHDVGIEFVGETRSFPFRDGGGLFLIRVPFEGMHLHYQDGFADIEAAHGVAEFRNQGFSASSSGARIAGVEVGEAHVAIADFRDAELVARGHAHGDVRAALAFLQESPVGPKLGPFFMKLAGEGPFSAAVLLNLPLRRFAERDIDVDARLEHATARLPGLTSEVRDLVGSFHVRNRDVEVPQLTGTLLGGPVTLRARTQAGRSGEHVLSVEAQGHASGAQLQPLLAITRGRWLEGGFDWRAQARWPRLEWRPRPEPLPADAPPNAIPVPHETEVRLLPASLRLDASLAGLAITLPAPLAKAAAETRPLHVDLAIDPGLAADAPALPATRRRREAPRAATIAARAQLGRDSAALEWRGEGELRFTRGTLHFDGAGAALHDASGLLLEGHLAEYDLSAWLRVKLGPGTGAGLGNYLHGGSVAVDRFAVFGFRFPDVTVALEGRDQAWHVQVDGPAAHGTLLVPWDLPGTQPLVLDMDRLVLEERAPAEGGAVERTDPTQLPAMRIAVRNLEIQKRRFGALEAALSRSDAGLKLEHATLKGAAYTGSGHGSWSLARDAQSCLLSFTLDSSNVLDTLTAWGFAPTLTGRAGHASAELHWRDGIDGDVLARLAGTVKVAIEEGQVTGVEPGAGRVLGLMSVAALPRRLTLDFSDLTDKGFAFDTVTGSFEFRDGNAYTTDLVLKGPAAEIGVVGRTGLVAHDYDQTAKVTGHFGGPIAAAGMLAAGPAVGAALLLFSKVFKEQLSGIARGYYRITGSWEKPRIDRIGAGEAREAQAVQEAQGAKEVQEAPEPPAAPQAQPGPTEPQAPAPQLAPTVPQAPAPQQSPGAAAAGSGTP